MGKIPMRSAIAIRKEHKAVCSKMDDLTKEARAAGHRQGPLAKDEALYFRLFSIQQTLEWVYPPLIKTSGKGRENGRWNLPDICITGPGRCTPHCAPEHEVETHDGSANLLNECQRLFTTPKLSNRTFHTVGGIIRETTRQRVGASSQPHLTAWSQPRSTGVRRNRSLPLYPGEHREFFVNRLCVSYSVFLLLFLLSLVFGATAFSQTVTFNRTTQSNIASRNHIDLNNDGREDFVYFSETSCANGFLVALSNGDDSYASSACYTLPSGAPLFIAMGDFNGDGNPDLIVTSGSSNFYEYLNRGNGTLRLQATFVTQTIVYAAIAADVNHDGRIDLIFNSPSAATTTCTFGLETAMAASPLDQVLLSL